MRFLYNEKDTFVHRMSPQAKLGAMLISFILPVTFNHPAYMAAIVGVTLIYAAAARAWDILFQFRKLLLILLVVSWVLWSLLLREGAPLFRVGPISVSSLSLLYGVAMALRVTTYVAMGLVFLSATTVEELTAGLRKLGLPYSLGFALSTSFRLVPTFIDTTKSVSEAQRARGLNLEEGSPLTRARKHLPLFIPILASCIRRSGAMAMALEARGFGAPGKRTCYRSARMGRGDWAVVAGLALAAAVAIVLRASGHGILLTGRL
jgi:energy-coupling factor transport system permease protein